MRALGVTPGRSHTMTPRDNRAWVEDLRPDSPRREQAGAELRHSLAVRLRPILSRRGLSLDCVEDVVQEASARVLERLDSFRGESQFLTWAISIGIRTGFELLRKGLWSGRTLPEVVGERPLDLSRAVDLVNESPARALERGELLEALRAAIRDDLTERQRVALTAELQGMPLSEIGRHLDASRNAVYKLTHDARKKLRQALERAGFDAESVRWALAGDGERS